MAGRNRRLQRMDVRSAPQQTLLHKLAGLLFIGIILCMAITKIFLSFDGNTKKTQVYKNPSEIPDKILKSFDAVLILGGGRPISLNLPPSYVVKRCDLVVEIVKKYKQMNQGNFLPLLTLSAGTAHVPQFINQDGSPLYESTSSAAYLIDILGEEYAPSIFLETTSYDTIGNAYFSRTSHTDITGWRKLLIITSEFHMKRTIAIFDWIFGIDPDQYELFYLSSPDEGLSAEALVAREAKEQKSIQTVQMQSQQYQSLKSVWKFLNSEHDLYSATGLIKRAESTESKLSESVRKSYGG